MLVVDGAQLSIPLVVKRVIDSIAAGEAEQGSIAIMALLLVGLALVIATFRFLWRHFFFSAARLSEMELRLDIFNHVVSLPAKYFSKIRTGEVMALATNDVESIREALAMGFVAGFDASAYAMVALLAMFFLDPVLSLWTIVPLPLLAVLMLYSLRAIYDRWDKVQASFEEMTEKVRESIAGMRILRAYVQGEGDSRDFGAYSSDYYRRYMSYVRLDAMFHPAILLVAGTCMGILLGVGGGRVIGGSLSIGSFVAFSSYLGMLTWPMIAAGWMGSLIQRASASMDRIKALLEESPERLGDVPEGRLDSVSISARGLVFSYPGQEQPALDGISFELPEGGSIGFVGEVGSGKSTLPQLLCRIWEPPRGALFMGGSDIVDMDLSAVRAAISYVPQEPFLFSDTIAENLRVGSPGATVDDMVLACMTASLHDEIVGFPDGYETLIGERGITLSGGQKQRLCLARALLKPSPVLILDDTLSAVDAETERAIIRNLSQRPGRQSKIVVSNRVSSVKDLDMVVVLRGGRVIQRGTHQALSAEEGYYREMVELQQMVGS